MKTIGHDRAVGNRAPAALLFFFVSLTACVATADDSPMLYFFTSKGCAPCIQVKHVIRQLGDEGYPVTTIDVGERPDWADAFRVTHTPTLALTKNDEVLAWQPRPMRAEELRSWFRAIQFSPVINPSSQRPSARSTPARKSSAATSSNSFATTRPAQTKVSLASKRNPSRTHANFTSPTMHEGTRTPTNELEARALGATVRLQVKDEGGTSYATGTVVHTHGGESLVVTCGHVFRESKGLGEITAEFGFENGKPVRVSGKVLDYDSDANDIALVAIKNGTHRLQAVEIAASNTVVDRNDRVFSLGCDHGDDPTIRNTAIKNLARYDGSLKYDIFGRPVNGRSGGGLFNAQGQLIGVCNAAAVEVDEGIYTALETVHWQIAKSNLDHLFVPNIPERDFGRTAVASSQNSFGNQDLEPRRMVPIRRRPRSQEALASSNSSPVVTKVSLAQQVQPYSDREVVITIRSRSNPSDSRTITISDPTPKLLDYLDGLPGDESRVMRMAQFRENR